MIRIANSPRIIVGAGTPAAGRLAPPGVGEAATTSLVVGVEVGLELEVGVAVGFGADVFVGVGVGDGSPPLPGSVGVGVGDGVPEGTGVFVGVLVGVFVGVFVGVDDGPGSVGVGLCSVNVNVKSAHAFGS